MKKPVFPWGREDRLFGFEIGIYYTSSLITDKFRIEDLTL